MNEFFQSCPKCNSRSYAITKYPGIVKCNECQEMYEDEEEDLEYRRRNIKKKQRDESDD